MRTLLSATAVVAVCQFALTSVSCTPSQSDLERQASDVLRAQKQEDDAVLDGISPVRAPITGSIAVVIPTDEAILQAHVESLRRVSAKIEGDIKLAPGSEGRTAQLLKNRFLFMVEVLKKRCLFDTVTWRQSTDPEEEQFAEDFALVFSVKKEQWLLRARRMRPTQKAIPIQGGPTSLSPQQQTEIWLTRIEEAARKMRSE